MTTQIATSVRGLPDVDEAALGEVVTRVQNQWPSAGIAVAVVRDGRPPWFDLRGMADVSRRQPVNPETVFRIGSLTKVVTAVAILQLWEEGRIDLDAPANAYLRAFEITRARPDLRPTTIRHLLTHTSGIGYWRSLTDLLRPGPGSGVQADRVVPLAELYRRGLPQEVQPGTKWAYSNHAFAALGQTVEDVSGLPLERFYRERILDPLGMRHSSLSPSRRDRTDWATGYLLRRRGLVPVEPKEVPTPGSGGLYSTVADLARFLEFLLRPEPSGVLRQSTVSMMFEPHFQPDPRLPGMGLAFDLARDGGERIVSKTGTVAGFHSMLALAPEARTGVVVLTNTGGLSGQGAAVPLGGALLRSLLDLPADPVGTDVEPHPQVWSELCGWYAPTPGPVTNLFTRALMGAGVEVVVEQKTLMLKPMSPVPAMRRGMRLYPDDADDPEVFRIDLSDIGMGAMPLVFARDPAGRLRFFMDLIEFDKQPQALNPLRLAATGLAVGAATIAVHGLRARAERR